MSTLNVANITDGTDTVPTGYVVNGSAKAWVNYNTRTTSSIGSSFNVSSISDDGTGLTSINFTAFMSDANFCQTMGMGDMNTTWTTSHAMATTNDGSKTSSRTKFHTGGQTVGSASDLYENCVMVMGDLA